MALAAPITERCALVACQLLLVGRMPIYEYQCQACGHTMEVILGEPPQKCGRCGRPDPVRILSAHRVAAATAPAGESLCCGRTERPDSCVPGSCCGEAGDAHGGGHR